MKLMVHNARQWLAPQGAAAAGGFTVSPLRLAIFQLRRAPCFELMYVYVQLAELHCHEYAVMPADSRTLISTSISTITFT
jgi:hypothetical protein